MGKMLVISFWMLFFTVAMSVYGMKNSKKPYNNLCELGIGAMDVDSKRVDAEGKTLLMRYARQGFEAGVKWLLGQKNVDINEQDNRGRTALHYALERGNAAIVRKLLDAGADHAIQDKFGKAGISYLVLNRHKYQPQEYEGLWKCMAIAEKEWDDVMALQHFCFLARLLFSCN